jgi:sulfonate transport system ATP-binding protein
VTLDIDGLSKRFDLPDGRCVEALDNIGLTIHEGSFTCIVGASGCGKSTLLRIIAGLELEYQGRIRLRGAPIRGPGRDRGYVFQEHRLLPWLTVEANVALGLHHLPPGDRRRRALDNIDLVGLGGFAGALPSQLSGGMAQRVAIARALANQPNLLLLDEPFGALDALTRIQMHEEMLRIRAHDSTTVVMVTHDIEEAVYLGDEVVVLSARPGRIQARFPVPLPRPRDRSSPDFVMLRRDIFRQFFETNDPPFAYAI